MWALGNFKVFREVRRFGGGKLRRNGFIQVLAVQSQHKPVMWLLWKKDAHSCSVRARGAELLGLMVGWPASEKMGWV